MLNHQRGAVNRDILCCGCLLIIFFILLIAVYTFAKRQNLADIPPSQQGTWGEGGTGALVDDDCIEKINPKAKEYMDLVNKYARQYQLNPALVAGVIQQESGWNPNATSHAGAKGLMQLMPETAAGLGVSNAYDPEQNIMGGSKYLRQNLNTFNGDIDKTLAAYNAGPGAVEQYNGIPPYEETREYVRNVKANYQRFSDCLESVGGTAQLASGTRQELINKILENDENIKFTYIASSNELNSLTDNTLKFILAAGESGNGPIYITSLTRGRHSVNSYHYSGQGVDLDLNDNLQKWIYNNRDTLNIGELLGPIDMTPYQVPHHNFVEGHNTHIHVGVK